MNVLFLTQSKSLELFEDLYREMGRAGAVERAGFYLADSEHYSRFLASRPEFESEKHELLKEWEILARASQKAPDLNYLKQAEARLGDSSLWNALVADRRIYLGARATLEQDYASRYTHEQMLSILETAIREMEALFDRLKPGLVVGFICVTLGEYLAERIAKARGIPFLNLRPTRMKNYFYAGESVHEPSQWLGERTRQIAAQGIPERIRGEVAEYITQVRGNHAMYEGVIPPPGTRLEKPSQSVIKPERPGLLARAVRFIGKIRRYSSSELKHDNHYRGPFFPIWFGYVRRPLRIRAIARMFADRYVQARDLAGMEFAFYPLHKEPEVTLLVYSKPYLNQIEVIRNLARSLPVGMKLLVKEHPAALGYRGTGYYRKLLEIPNVLLVDPSVKSRDLVQASKLVAVISGSVGLEAVMMAKPVVVFGHVPFAWLPPTMLRCVKDQAQLDREISDLLLTYRFDESALSAFVAAVFEQSVPVDFYSRLLGRQGVYQIGEGREEQLRREHLSLLAGYVLKKHQERFGKSGIRDSSRPQPVL